jgi:hypothetical protein
MTLVQYTAEVKDGLLLELPEEAEELHLKPGDRVQVRIDRNVEDTPQAKSRENGRATGPQAAVKPKELRGRGMLAGVLNSEDFLRRKHEETALEDRSIR